MKPLVSGIIFLVSVVVPARADTADVKPVAVPFELLQTKHMVIRIKVNDKGPYRVIFDTGAPISLLNNKVAREAGLLKNAPKPLFNLFGMGGEVKIKKLQVGELKAEGVTAIVMDHPTIEAISSAFGPIEGIIGFPFFARYRMTLDYQAKQMTFVPNGFDPPDVLQSLMANVMGIMQDKKPARRVLAPAAQWGLVITKAEGDEEAGVAIQEILPATAAAAAGLKVGDRLLTLDGRWTDSVADCYSAASHVKPGAAVKVVVRRDGRETELTVKPTFGL